ncbi:MAG: glycosyltransferase [Candidatus Lokiarchaeia archaeon]
MEKLISVLMPVFKANPQFLEQSVESILSQTHSEIELIIILDPYDHQTDHSTLEVLELFRDDHRSRLIVNKTRLGLISSMNKGIRLAQGDFMGRMDCDDIAMPTRIEEQVDWLSRKGLDLVGCWSYVIDDNGKILGSLHPPSDWLTIRKYLLLQSPFIHSSVLFSQHVVKTIGLYNPNFELSEDYEFYLRAFSNGFMGANIPSYLHFLREHPKSLIRSKKWKKDRFLHTKNVFSAFFSYGFRKPLDLTFLLITPLCVFIKPSHVLFFKRLFGFYK